MSDAQIINPHTPLAYLSPDLGVLFQVSRYLCVVFAGVSAVYLYYGSFANESGYHLGLSSVDA